MRVTYISCIFLLFTAGGNGRNVTFLFGTYRGVSLFNTGAVNPVDTIYSDEVKAVDYHLNRNLVYFYSDGTLFRSTLTPTTGPEFTESTAVAKMGTCRGFAVDWIHDVIYWVDCHFQCLKLMDLEGKNVTTIIKNLGQMTLVQKVGVDPQVGKVFWLADGTLHWCDLTGDNYTTNLSQIIKQYVTSFTLDIQAGRLFYVGITNINFDLPTSTDINNFYEIFYTADGTDGSRKLPISSQMGNVYDISVLHDYLYWKKRENIEAIYNQTLNTNGELETIRTFNRYVYQMRIVDPELQKPFSGDPCRHTPCSHFCVHQRGVARCLCPDGVGLITNTTCSGGDGNNVTFLLGTSKGVSMFNTTAVDSLATTHPNLKVWAVDYHMELNLVYFFSDETLYRSTLVPTTDPVSVDTSIVSKMSYCSGFAVDWLHNVIYWVDCHFNSLKLMDMEGKHVTTIIVSLYQNQHQAKQSHHSSQQVERVEVDPQVGKVFWLANVTLEWCDLTGDNYRTNLSKPGVSVTSFTLDIPASRLFYIGTESRVTILYEIFYRADGTVGLIKQLPSPQTEGVHSLVILGNTIYWANTEKNEQIIYSQTLNTTVKPGTIRKIKSVVWHMKVVNSDLQKPVSGDPCRHTPCSHFCVHQRGVARCLCLDGMNLVNNTTCLGGERRIVTFLVGTEEGVGMFSSAADDSLTTIATTTSRVFTVDYHLERNDVYFHHNRTLFKSSFVSNDTSSYTIVKEVGICEGFAVDWVHNVIYWMDCSNNSTSIKLMDLEGNNVTTVMKRPGGKARVRRMAVDPHVGKVFWLDRWTLAWCDLTGESFSNLSNSSLFVNTFALDVPSRRLLFVVLDDDSIYEMLYYSTGTIGTTKQTRYLHMRHFLSISVLGDYLYCSTENGIYRLPTTTITTILPPELIQNIYSIYGMRLVDTNLQKPFSEDPCQYTTCSHFCVHQKRVARCLCPDGMFLGNKMTCSAKITGIKFILYLVGYSLQFVVLIGLLAATFSFMLHVNGRYFEWPIWMT